MPLEIEILLKNAEKAKADLEALRGKVDTLQESVDRHGSGMARLGVAYNEISEVITRYASAAGIATAVTVGFVEAIGRGAADAERHDRAVRQLGNAYDLVAEATAGVVTEEQTLRVQQVLNDAGMQVSAEQLAVITRRAREFARSHQMEMGPALEQTTSALVALSGRGMRQFGVTLDETQPRAQNFASAIDQMRDSFHGTQAAAADMGETMAMTRNSIGDLAAGIAGHIADFIHLRDILSEIAHPGEQAGRIAANDHANDVLHDHNRAMARFEAAAQRATSAGVSLGPRDLSGLGSLDLDSLSQTIEQSLQGAHDRGTNGTPVERELLRRRLAPLLAGQNRRDADAIIASINATASTTAGSASAAFDAQVTARTEAMNAGKVGASAHAAGSHTLTAAQLLQQHIDDARKEEEAVARQTEISRAQAALDEQKQEDEVARERLESDRRADNDRLDELQRATSERMRLREEESKHTRELEREQDDLRAQVAQRFAQHAELTETTAQGMAGLVEGSYQTMTGALKSHLAAVFQGKEDIGTALKGILQEILLNLAVEATVKALFQTAEGIAALVTPGGQAAAGGHFIAAGEYAAVAAIAGIGSAIVGSIGNGPSRSSGGGHASIGAPASTGGTGNSGGATVVNLTVNGTIMDKEGTANAVGYLINDLEQRNNLPRAIRRNAA